MSNIKKKKKLRLRRFHISFYVRICAYLIMFLFALILGFYFVYDSLNIQVKENLKVTENGSVDYLICLDENDFFEKKCLDKNMIYVASLINNIPLTFNYQLSGNKDVLKDSLEYDIKAKVVIKNSDNTSKYYEKEYVLEEKTSEGVNFNRSNYSLKKAVNIDYNYYNNIATKFKSQYNVDAESYLDVTLTVYNHIAGIYNMNSSNNISVRIPLSQKAIQIKLNTQEINNVQEQVIVKEQEIIDNNIRLVCGVILWFFSLIYFGYFMNLILLLFKSKKTYYDKYVNKILKEYDRLIVETTSLPKFSDYNMMKVNSFNELLDVRDNLKLPIMFYTVVPHQKAYLYILHDKNIYLFTLKDVDLTK